MLQAEATPAPGGTPPNYRSTPNVSYFYDNVPNAKGKLIKVSSSVSTTEYTPFDILGRVTASKQTTGHTADSDLGALSGPNQPTYYTYSPRGKMGKVSQGVQRGYFLYDSLGRLVRIRQPEQDVNSNLDLSDPVSGNSQWTAGFTYDVLGNVIRATDAIGVNIITEYDKASRVIRRCYTKPDVSLTSNAARCSQIPAAIADINANNLVGLGTTAYDISTVPNALGTAVITTDASGRKGRAITNASGQLIRVDEPTATGGTVDADLGTLASPAQPTYYTYSPQGKMVKVSQGVQNRYFLYDSLGRLIRVRQPEQEINASLNLSDPITGNPQWTAGFSYDVLGNVLTATDAKGTVITNAYDRANRVTTRSYSNEPAGVTTPAINFYYDGKGLAQTQSPNFAIGRLTRVASSVSETRYSLFDNFGRLTRSSQITDGQVYTSAYRYNLSGALIEETYPSGRVVKNEFESDGDLSRIYGKANPNAVERTYANSFTYTPDGRIEKLKLGNGLWERASFNTRLQVTELALGRGLNGDLWRLGYEYGELNTDGTVNAARNTGNIARQTLSFDGLAQPFVQTYRYDSLYRLTEARETSGTGGTAPQTWMEAFGYDRYGNRTAHDKFYGTTRAAESDITDPTIDAATNRFTANQGYLFDRNGNLIADPENRAFTFNGDNKQTKVIQNGQLVGEYFFDGEGRRVKKKTYNNGAVSEETIFVYSSGKLVAEYSTAPPAQNPTTSFTATDQLGSPRVITNSLGEVTSRRDFMPFGEQVMPDDANRTSNLKYNFGDPIRQKFTGYERDIESDLDFAQARMYNSRHGRFTAVDPLLASANSANPQTFNRYTYVLNNPLALVDRTGAFPEFTFSVYVRAFAPFAWFGPGNVARGDNRGFSTDPAATYRIQASSEVTAANDGRYFPMSITRQSEPTTSETNLGLFSWTAKSECYINDPAGNYYADGLPGGNDSLGYQMYGNDDAIPGSSDIDLNPQFRFNYDDRGNGVVNMSVTGSVTGDQFPAAEAFIRDGSGNSVMLGVFAPAASSGPVGSLPGNNTRPMIDVNVTVQVNNGVFQGVVENGNLISLDEYNRRFTSQAPVRPNQ